jgi:TetR/AcrR family transcriptional regulator, cholesterol catabolism regulator
MARDAPFADSTSGVRETGRTRRGIREPQCRGGTRRPRTRDREIVNAAAKLFHRNGYGNTSIQEIADAVGMRRGSLYHHIESKDDLLYWVVREVLDHALATVKHVTAVTTASPMERVAGYVDRHVRYSLRHLSKIAVFWHDCRQLSPERFVGVLGQRQVCEDFLETLIREAQRAGEAEPAADAHVLAQCAFSLMIWPYTWYRPKGRISVSELGAMLVELSVKGIQNTTGALASTG